MLVDVVRLPLVRSIVMLICLMVACLLGCATPSGYQPTGFVPKHELAIVRLVNQGISEFSRSRFDDAEMSFQEALALQPDHRRLRHNLAVTHFRMGAYVQAEAVLRDLLQTSSEPLDRIELYFELGSLYAAQLDFERSLAFLESGLSEYRQLAESQTEASVAENLADDALFKAVTTESVVETLDNVRERSLPLLVILEALVEVAWNGGEYAKARCYAQLALEEKARAGAVDYSKFINDVRILSGMGYDRQTQFILENIVPQVLVKRNAAMAHTLSLSLLAQGAVAEYLEWEQKARQAYDSNELILRESEHLQSLMATPGVVELPSVLEQQILFWPARLRELQFLTAEELGAAEVDFWKVVLAQLEESKQEAGKLENNELD